MPGPEQFVLMPPPTLPVATAEALMAIPSPEKRAWIASILISSIVRGGNLDDLRRSLVGERVDRDLIERIVDPMKETKP